MNDYCQHGASTHLSLSRNIRIKPVIWIEICIKHNNDITKEPISLIEKTIFNIFRPNHRVGTKPPPIFISMKINANKHKQKKHSKNHIDKLTILHNPPQKITHNRVDVRAVHDNDDVEENQLPQQNQLTPRLWEVNRGGASPTMIWNP